MSWQTQSRCGISKCRQYPPVSCLSVELKWRGNQIGFIRQYMPKTIMRANLRVCLVRRFITKIIFCVCVIDSGVNFDKPQIYSPAIQLSFIFERTDWIIDVTCTYVAGQYFIIETSYGIGIIKMLIVMI